MLRINNRDSCITGNPVYSIRDYLLDQSNETHNFNSHVSYVAHNAHVHASLILWTFVSRDPKVLMNAFTTYVCPLLEYCMPVWSTYTVCNDCVMLVK